MSKLDNSALTAPLRAVQHSPVSRGGGGGGKMWWPWHWVWHCGDDPVITSPHCRHTAALQHCSTDSWEHAGVIYQYKSSSPVMGCRFKVPPSSIQGSIQGSTSLSASIIFSLTELNFSQHQASPQQSWWTLSIMQQHSPCCSPATWPQHAQPSLAAGCSHRATFFKTICKIFATKNLDISVIINNLSTKVSSHIHHSPHTSQNLYCIQTQPESGKLSCCKITPLSRSPNTKCGNLATLKIYQDFEN